MLLIYAIEKRASETTLQLEKKDSTRSNKKSFDCNYLKYYRILLHDCAMRKPSLTSS